MKPAKRIEIAGKQYVLADGKIDCMQCEFWRAFESVKCVAPRSNGRNSAICAFPESYDAILTPEKYIKLKLKGLVT